MRLTLDSLIGETFVSIQGAEVGSDSIRIETASGRKFHFYHGQDCCESVQVEDVIGDFQDLLNSPIVMAEEITSSSSEPNPAFPAPPGEWTDISYTWTFYKFATNRGYVTIRWLGTSNGYYSESVDFVEILPQID